MHRQELDRGNAEPLQVLGHEGVREARKGAAFGLGDVREQSRHATHMGFVEDRVIPRRVGAPVVPPLEAILGHRGFHDCGRAVAPVEAQIRARAMHAIAEHGIGPSNVPHELLCVWVEQELVRIEAMTVVRLVRPMRAKTVHEPWLRLRQVAMPDVEILFRQPTQERIHLLAGQAEVGHPLLSHLEQKSRGALEQAHKR